MRSGLLIFGSAGERVSNAELRVKVRSYGFVAEAKPINQAEAPSAISRNGDV
jgi:hypothetical protein